VDRTVTHPAKVHSELTICTQWMRSINASLNRDRILTNKSRFGPLSFNKNLVLDTWSGLLLNEDLLPDDCTYKKGVLVGIQPYTVKNGIG
jgi:ribonuclease HI